MVETEDESSSVGETFLPALILAELADSVAHISEGVGVAASSAKEEEEGTAVEEEEARETDSNSRSEYFLCLTAAAAEAAEGAALEE